MTIDALHPDIVRSERGRETVGVIDPSPGLFGGDPVEGLVTVAYACPPGARCGGHGCDCEWHAHPEDRHTHHALYGHQTIHFADDCAECGKFKHSPRDGHEYSPRGVEEIDSSHYELYAD